MLVGEPHTRAAIPALSSGHSALCGRATGATDEVMRLRSQTGSTDQRPGSEEVLPLCQAAVITHFAGMPFVLMPVRRSWGRSTLGSNFRQADADLLREAVTLEHHFPSH